MTEHAFKNYSNEEKVFSLLKKPSKAAPTHNKTPVLKEPHTEAHARYKESAAPTGKNSRVTENGYASAAPICISSLLKNTTS